MLSKLIHPVARAVRSAKVHGKVGTSSCFYTTDSLSSKPLFDSIGENSFCDEKLRNSLSKSCYNSFHSCLSTGESLSKEDANEVAQALMNWAISKGCTQYAHWYMPMRQHDGRAASACKLDGFIDLDYGASSNLKPIVGQKFSGSLLFQNETDGSSYPNGGLRATHTAAAFVSWDKSSAPYLVASGRMLYGALSDRNQENCENYFGIPHHFMTELQQELWKLNVAVVCQHNEVAPSQHELAPIFSLTNVAADQNVLMMEVMDKIAASHGLKVLFHEKPFAGINGSGKHNNWGLNTNTGKNLYNPGKTEESQSDFMAFTAALMYAINKHGDVIRAGVACAGNDHRLGAQEAPPAIISLYTGERMHDHMKSIVAGGELPGYGGEMGDEVSFGSRALQKQIVALEDRNRTAPFPFCGNRFEFRAVGSSQNIAQPLAFLNTAVADGMDHLSSLIEGGLSPRDAVAKILGENDRCVFNGNGYSAEWPVEAKNRGLLNNRDCVSAWKDFDNQKNVNLFSKYGVFSEQEVPSRKEVALGEYTNTLHTEALCALHMADTGVLPACAKDLKNYTGASECERPVLYAQVASDTEQLKSLLSKFPSHSTTLIQAEYCANTLKPQMNQLRENVDMAERLCEGDLWPYVLFIFNVLI